MLQYLAACARVSYVEYLGSHAERDLHHKALYTPYTAPPSPPVSLSLTRVPTLRLFLSHACTLTQDVGSLIDAPDPENKHLAYHYELPNPPKNNPWQIEEELLGKGWSSYLASGCVCVCMRMCVSVCVCVSRCLGMAGGRILAFVCACVRVCVRARVEEYVCVRV